MATKRFDAKKEAIRFLQSQLIAVVATLSRAGRPQAATVYFWVNDVEKGDAFNFYFLTRRHSRKFENLLKNKEVSMVVGTEFAPSTVQISGKAEIVDVENHLTHMSGLIARLKKHPTIAMLYAGAFFPKNPFKNLGGDYAFVKVTPTWVRWMRFDKTKMNVVYHQIVGDDGAEE